MAKVVTTHGKYKGVIVSKTDMRKLKAGLQAKMKDIVALLVKQLSYIGEECIRIARESGSYNDITGNLRSSIGYVVLVDGKPVVTGASKQYNGKNGHGEAGPPAAEALLQKLQAKFPWGVVLIVCAGMKYAAYYNRQNEKCNFEKRKVHFLVFSGHFGRVCLTAVQSSLKRCLIG